MDVGRFCAMIGALVWCSQTNRYLFLKRVESRGGKWECVTGRLSQGEGFVEAIHREVYEEIGVSVQVDFMIGTTHFYRGEKRIENEMVGVHFGCSVTSEDEIRLSSEHSEYRWLTAAEAAEFLPEGRWLNQVLERAEVIRKQIPPELLDYFQMYGFDVSTV